MYPASVLLSAAMMQAVDWHLGEVLQIGRVGGQIEPLCEMCVECSVGLSLLVWKHCVALSFTDSGDLLHLGDMLLLLLLLWVLLRPL